MSIFSIFERRRRKGAISAYLIELRPALGRTFGKSEHYTPAQVQKAATVAGLSDDLLDVGMAAYGTSEDYRAYQVEHGSMKPFWEVREEIGKLFFGGNAAFSQLDVAHYAKAKAGPRPSFEGDASPDQAALGKYGGGGV